jgi:uncharacterized iron-regulated membrane protein
MFRKILFWMHLISGLLAGLVIFMMSLTGVILTFERQILHWSEHICYLDNSEQSASPLSISSLLEIGQQVAPELDPDSIILINHPGAPVSFAAGRAGNLALNPYSGEPVDLSSPGLERFFNVVTGWHRWFNQTGESRSTARAITGACNLAFLFLLLSGIYLWFPKIWHWTLFKSRLLFIRNAPSSVSRDFNWHHVFGIWCVIPLLIIVATATVFNYSWANNLVYQVYGEQAPQRGRATVPTSEANSAEAAMNADSESEYLSLDELMLIARQATETELGEWHSIALNLPKSGAAQVEFSVNQTIGGQPQKQYTLSIDRSYGSLLSISGLSDRSPGAQTRSIIRFLHTGEVLGIWGQAVAGLVSLASLFMVWTGFALAYRRLIQPLFRKS